MNCIVEYKNVCICVRYSRLAESSSKFKKYIIICSSDYTILLYV